MVAAFLFIFFIMIPQPVYLQAIGRHTEWAMVWSKALPHFNPLILLTNGPDFVTP